MDPDCKTHDTALVGIIIGSHGTSGETKIHPHSDNPERFKSGNMVVSNGETLKIERSDPTWESEYRHFKKLCREGSNSLDNDIWINRVLRNLAEEAG